MLWLGVGMQPSERDGESSAGAAMQLLGAPGLFSALCHLACPGAVPAAPLAGNLPPGFTGDTIFFIHYPNKSLFLLGKENYSDVHQRNGHSLGLLGRCACQYVQKAAGSTGIPPACTVALD